MLALAAWSSGEYIYSPATEEIGEIGDEIESRHSLGSKGW
jgi:hypothetical protein